MRKWISDISKALVGNILVVVLATAGVSISAWLQSLPWYVIALSGIGAFGLTFFSINQLAVFRERRSNGFATLDNERIEATLRKWLDNLRYKIQADPQDNRVFQFKAEDSDNRVMIVARPKEGLTEFILVGGSWTIPQDLQPKFDGMTDDERNGMLEELKIEMLRLKVSYSGFIHPLRQVGVQVRVPCDETCTQSLFLQQFETAKFAYILMTVVMEKALRQTGNEPDENSSQP